MARPKNTLLRILVPLGALAVVVLIAAAVLKSTSARTASRHPPAPAQPASPETAPRTTPPPEPTADQGAAASPQAPGAPAPGTGVPGGEPQPSPAPIAGLRALEVPPPPSPPAALGSLDPSSGFLLRVEFSDIGAGVRSIRLARHRESTRRDSPNVEVQAERVEAPPGGRRRVLTPLAASRLTINGRDVILTGASGRAVWEETGPGAFRATIADEAGTPVARVTRRYVLTPGTYDLLVEQRVENLSAAEIDASWVQYGPVEFPPDLSAYGGDKRRVRFGYVLKPALDPGQQTVLAAEYLWGRSAGPVLGPKDPASGQHPGVWTVWPNRLSQQKQHDLAWLGVTSRYFGVALHPAIDASGPPPYDKTPDVARTVDRVLMSPADPGGAMAMLVTSAPRRLAPGESAALDFALYAGPLSRPAMQRHDAARDRLRESGLRGLVVYNFGGMCGWCTFPVLTGALLWLMDALHAVLRDWSIAIILLVVVVRTILHPVNKWSQIRMQRLGKQMQDLAPKQKKIQEKYGSDRKKIQEETAKLWRESGVNPFQMVGCIPPFLQTPIWIALYAMLYFAVELRHEPAFFGLFQAISGGRWLFLADLSEPDGFVPFGETFMIPLMGPVSSLNILPIILGIIFYIQQRFFMPAPATMTPEQKQQQAIVKWMMVVMFPLMMYAQPSGLALYFVANTTLAILESIWIKRTIKAKDLLNPEKFKRPAPGGFLARMQQMAEQRRQAMEGRAGRVAGPAAPPARKPRRGDEPPRRFRERR